jgi:diketogulonate reductase-like aldo/keto reductase
VDTWKAFEKLYADKRIRAIGVSNFKPAHLEELMAQTEIVPAVNQIELHPKLAQLETREYCEIHNIKIESYSPLMQGGEILNDPIIRQIADKYGKTPAQVVLRWHIQNGLIVIPKSVTPSRIRENIDIFDFELADQDLQAINTMNAEARIGADPDTATF